MTIFCGIDNGLSGGIAMISINQAVVKLIPMPVIKGKKTEYDIQAINQLFAEFTEPSETYTILEKAHVRPISGKRACFMNGFGYGMMQGVLEGNSIGYEIVRPKDWQSEILKGINTGDTKKDSIMFCKRKFPNIDLTPTERSTKPSDGMADALCMAVYCYRRNKE